VATTTGSEAALDEETAGDGEAVTEDETAETLGTRRAETRGSLVVWAVELC